MAKGKLRLAQGYVILVLIMYGAAAALRTAVVADMKNRGGTVVTCQVLRNIAIMVWSFFFVFFTMVKSGSCAGKKAHLEFTQSTKWRFRTIGAYMVAISFIHTGDPSLVLMYGGVPAIQQQTGIQDFVSTVDPDIAFDLTLGVILYGVLTGLMLVAVSFRL
ncbi:hypothetical protein H4R18_003910 [Coemansia javaensis]|uniref:Uncharacterized protein n=1 Tax=Coemansia javaensis TaxID=2761396 RepID=A0A9W8H947_9FUNG|nr:hypothetical protein H4R18_003910 [Coemansia javaensis]